MAHEITKVETVGYIQPPTSSPSLSPEEFAKGERTTTMVFDQRVLLTVEHGVKVLYPVGTHEVPDRYVNHWYLLAHGVRPYAKPVQISDSPSPKGKRTK